MSHNRRQLLFAAPLAASAWALPHTPAASAEADEFLVGEFPPLPAGWTEQQADYSPTLVDIEQLGSSPPLDDEVRTAQELLTLAPYDQKNPLAVAEFFEAVGQGDFDRRLGRPVRHYVRGWPVRYNPVVVNFFKATGTNPLSLDGDYTAWCAAFVNWCIARSLSRTKEVQLNSRGLMSGYPRELLRGTASASSGSFRCWSSERPIDQAERGDVFVWATRGTVNGCRPGTGHV